MVDELQIRFVLFHSICDLKAVQVNGQRNLIWELMIYELKLSHGVIEAKKKQKNSFAKNDGTVERSKEIGGLKDFRSMCKNIDF